VSARGQRSDLERAVSAVVNDCLGVREGEQVLVICNPRTLGLGELTGSLLPGKWADMCCVDLRTPRTWPVDDVVEAVLCAASAQVTDTWVAGRQLLAERRLTLLDESAVLGRAEGWWQRLEAQPSRETPGDG